MRRPEGPYGGIDVPPNHGTQFVPPLNPANPAPPPVSVIVRKNAAGNWLDDNNGDWSRFISGDLANIGGTAGGRVAGWDLPDRDVAVVNTATLGVTYQTRLMNSLMALAVRPGTGEVTVVGTDANNQIRWEPNLQSTFVQVNFARFLPGGTSTIGDLNPHLNYAVRSVPPAVRAQSIGDPRGLAWSPDGAQAWVTGMGSNNVIIMNPAGARLGLVNVGQGPTGIIYQAATSRVFVLNKFDASISVINAAQMQETARVAFFDPTPAVVKLGRPFLYNTHNTSGLGQVSCASCHLDGRTDALAWDLGNPAGNSTTLNGIDDTTGATISVQQPPMKGPMLTSTLEDKMNNPSLHFSGDRADISAFASAFQTLQGADAPLAADAVNKLEDFLATIHVPPNPNRNLDNTYNTALPVIGPDGVAYRTGNAAAGAVEFEGNCRGCHPGNTARGDKIRQGGAFGVLQYRRPPTWRNFNYRAGLWFKSATGSTMGFGYQQDGSFDSTHNASRDDNMMAFMYSVNGRFPYVPNGLDETNESRDTHAAVGQQLLFTSAAASPGDANLALFTQLAEHGEVGLIAKATVGGLLRGYAYVGDGTFQSDRRRERDTVAQVRALPGVVFTVVPAGSETRLGIDHDLDGVFDGDDMDDNLATPFVRSQVNVAPRGVATQSSTYGGIFGPQLALDGDNTTFSHTASADTAPFWQVALDDTYAIDRIVVVNRAGFESRLRDISVLLYDAAGNPVYRSHFQNRNNRLNGPPSITLDLLADNGVPVHAKSLRIERTPDTFGRGQNIPANSTDEQNVLALAEVQVYGASSNGDALIVNSTPRPLPGGSFEDIDETGTSADAVTGTPWTFSANAGITGNNSSVTNQSPAAPAGTQVCYLINAGTATQTVRLLAGTYNLSLLAAQHPSSNPPASVVISVDGQTVGTYQPPGTSYTTYQSNAFTVTAGPHTIVLSQSARPGANALCAVLIDNVQISGVQASPVVAALGSQISARGSAVNLPITATDPNQEPLTYKASGLPSGLHINAATGLITGTVSPTALGTNNTSIVVSNGAVSRTLAFVWAATGDGIAVGQDNLVMTADNTYSVYVNGALLGTGADWQTAQQYLLDLAPGDVLAVDATNVGYSAGLLAQLQVDGLVSGTSTRWKTWTAAVPAGWSGTTYDDSAWTPASDYSSYGHSVWGTKVTGLPRVTPADWIWAAPQSTRHVYLRYTIPGPSTVATVPVVNGSFELPVVGTTNYVGNLTAAQQKAFGWTVSGNSGGSGPAISRIADGWGFPSPPDGSQSISLQTSSAIGQNVTFPAAGTYTLTWQAASRWGQVNPVNVEFDGAKVLTWQTANPAWTPFQVTLHVATAGVHRLAFVGQMAPGNDQSVGLDAVQIYIGTAP